MFKGYVDTSYGQIHYRMAGETGPIVFCLHESPVSSWEFEKTLPLLGARCRAIALDTPGYGQSDAPTGPLDIAGYARRMLPAIEHFAAGQKFAFATVHTGTSIALELITEHLADRTTHAVFSGVPMFTPEQSAAFATRISEPSIDAEGDFLKTMWTTRRKNWGEDTDLDIIHAAVSQHLTVYPRYHWAFKAVFSFDAKAALQKTHVSALCDQCRGRQSGTDRQRGGCGCPRGKVQTGAGCWWPVAVPSARDLRS